MPQSDSVISNQSRSSTQSWEASPSTSDQLAAAKLQDTPHSRPPVGRFAPSPTGELHLGSLTTAVASYCHIKSLGGQWRVRIEDTDTTRCHPKFSNKILMALETLGLHWDGEVIYQSNRTQLYNAYLAEVLSPLAYGCQCSRKTLKAFAKKRGTDCAHYPRLCLDQSLDPQSHKVRLQLPDHFIGFMDGIQGAQWLNPQQTEGDMVVRRKNGIINYILAASIDDGLQNITHVMRGLDIMPMTAAQISIMKAALLPAVDHWYHLPLILNKEGQKLSKQNLAQPIDVTNPSGLLQFALTLLQQPPVVLDTPARMLNQAIEQWDLIGLRGKQSLERC